MIAGLSFSPSFSLGSSLSPTLENHLNGFPDSGTVSPKLKRGENERPAVMITMCKGCHDNEQLRSNPGLELANALGVDRRRGS